MLTNPIFFHFEIIDILGILNLKLVSINERDSFSTILSTYNLN